MQVDRLSLPPSLVTRVVVGATREARLSKGWLRWEELYVQARLLSRDNILVLPE